MRKCDNDESRMTGDILSKVLESRAVTFSQKMFKELQIVHHIRGRGLGVGSPRMHMAK